MKKTTHHIILIIAIIVILFCLGAAIFCLDIIGEFGRFVYGISLGKNITSTPTPTPPPFSYTYTVLLDEIPDVEMEFDIQYQIRQSGVMSATYHNIRLTMDKNRLVSVKLERGNLEKYVDDDLRIEEVVSILSQNRSVAEYLSFDRNTPLVFYLTDSQDYVVSLIFSPSPSALFCVCNINTKQVCYMAQINLNDDYRFSSFHKRMTVNKIKIENCKE